TALAGKADKTAMDTALASKADQAAMNTALSGKADKTAMDTALASKVDQVAMNTALAGKADKSAMDTALASKADQAAVNKALADKADKSAMDTALANKADQAAVNTALADKADKTAMDTALASKADQAAVNTVLADKADKSAMDTALASKADQAAVNTALADKADKSAMDTALASKADQVAMNTALADKADKSAMDTALASKADQVAMNTALAGKADKTTIDTALNLKASKTELETATTNVVRFDPAKLVWSSDHAYKVGEVARFPLTGDMYVALKDINASQGIIPTVHAEYWAVFVNGQQDSQSKVVFATKQAFNANLGGLAGADLKCQVAANESNVLPAGTYKALINVSSNNATSVMPSHYSYYTVDGSIVAERLFGPFSSLTTLKSPINLDQNGDKVSGYAWTNMSYEGSFNHWSACAGFKTSSTYGDSYSFVGAKVGSIDVVSGSWRSHTNLQCSQQARLYCVQQ
ncbi:hypothetical protein, partial [Pseudoalteromonas luteoviolacea]